MNRPIKDWLEELEEPYRTQALENYNPEYSRITRGGLASSKADALMNAFWWRASSQGGDYWDEVHREIWESEKNNP